MHLLCRGSGYPILFIHGMPTSNQLWNSVIEQMCGSFQCFAVDLPGLGKTPTEPYGPDYLNHLAHRLDALRRQRNIDQWHVVGHDAGAAIAVHYAYAFQEHVSRLVLLSPPLFPDLKPYYLLEILRKPILGEFLAPLANSIFWNVVMPRAGRNEEGTNDSLLPSFRERFSGLTGPWQFMRLMRWGKPCEVLGQVPDILPRLMMPTLIVRGLRDPAIPESFAQRALRFLPNAELVHADCGHFIPLNKPAFLADRLRHFFGDRLGSLDANVEGNRFTGQLGELVESGCKLPLPSDRH
jgi:pimeloyl-ACP methyl ester carboxylesterase